MVTPKSSSFLSFPSFSFCIFILLVSSKTLVAPVIDAWDL